MRRLASVKNGNPSLEEWFSYKGIWFANIPAAANKVIDRYNRELGNYGFIRVTRRYITEIGGSFEPFPTMTVTAQQDDHINDIVMYFGFSHWFTYTVPDGGSAVCYDLSDVFNKRYRVDAPV